MTTRQASARIGVSQSRVLTMEKAEADGAITLTTLRKAAEGLGCELVYVLVPKQPLAETLRQRAAHKADQQLGRVNHTMRLENQAVSNPEYRRERELLIDEYLRGNLHRLWDEDL